MAENDDGLFVFGGCIRVDEPATEHRSHPENVEEIRGDQLPPDAARVTTAAQVHRHTAKGDHVFDPVGSSAPKIREVRIGEAQIVPRRRFAVQRDELRRVHARQRVQDYRFHPAENRCVRTDTQPEHQNSNQRERGPPDQHPPREPEVVGQHREAPFVYAEKDSVRETSRRAGVEREHATQFRPASVTPQPLPVVPEVRPPLSAPGSAPRRGYEPRAESHDRQDDAQRHEPPSGSNVAGSIVIGRRFRYRDSASRSTVAPFPVR